MADKSLIKIKRSAVSGNVPDTDNIVEGELALNTADRILYSRGGDDIFEVGANVSSLSIGGTEIIDSSGVWQGSSSGIKGEVGAKGQKGHEGVYGGGASVEMLYKRNIADSNPGPKFIKWNSLDPIDSNTVNISATDINNVTYNLRDFLDTLDDSTSSKKGYIRIAVKDDSSKYAIWTFSAVANNSSYHTLTATAVASTIGSLSDNTEVIATFSTDGDKGDKGDTGAKGATGTKGAQGAQGATGAAGSNGDKGQKGATGAKGVTGTKGAQGATGAAGSNGDKGQKGATGAKGVTGTKGAQGAQGATGAAGSNGDKGATGAKGVTGTKGAQGAQGATGAAGSNGDKGQKGATGATGAKGVTGTKGATGAAGSNGDKGQKGATGATGAKGVTGTKGATGAAGSNGDKGQKGATGADSTVAGAKGDQGQKGQTGADSTVAGAKGQKGEIGDKGATGADSTVAGAKGDQGQKGQTGADSTVAGAKGQKGATGADSTVAGAKGQKGATGADSTVAGAKGQKGEIGDKGATGADSTVAGDKGQKGQTGADSTVAGAKGQKGEIGDKGATGADSTVAGAKGQKGATGADSTVAGAKGQKGEIGDKGATGADSTVAGAKGQKGQTGADSTVAGDKGQKGDGFDTATDVIPTGGIGSGEHELFDEDGELVSQVWATTNKYTRVAESLGSPPHSSSYYPSSINAVTFAYWTSSISSVRLMYNGTNEGQELNSVQISDTVLIRSTTNKGRWFIARVDTVLRNSGTLGIDIKYNHSEAKSNAGGVAFDDLTTHFSGDTVELTFFNAHATGSSYHDETRLALGNASYYNTAKIRLNGSYHTSIGGYYPCDIGTVSNYHGDLNSSYRDIAFTTQSMYQGFVWRYNSLNVSSQAGMSLRADGRLNVAYGVRIGGGVSDTSNVSSTYRLYVSGQIYSTSNISAYSDKRAKENIKPITDGLDKVLKLEGVYYNMKEGHSPNEDHTRPRVGVLAQDVQEILPEVVTYAEEEDMYSVDYGNITAVLIEAIKDQQKIIESLSERISKLEK